MSWAEPEPERRYPSAEAWVGDWLAVHYARSLDSGGRVFCPQWREHPEAVSRLEALWLDWERAARDDGRATTSWWLSCADPTMAVLLDADSGPFAQCRRGHSDRLGPLPLGS